MTEREYNDEAAELRPTLIDLAVGYTKSRDDAEDIVQDVMLKLWTMRNDVQRPMSALARVLTRNLCVDFLRRRKPTVEALPANVQETVDEATTTEQVESLISVIDTLPANYQVVLRLRHIEGMTVGYMAGLMGSSEAAVRKALSRARQAVLRIYMEQKKIDNSEYKRQ